MALTKTINYTQNVETPLGFNNDITASGAASIMFTYPTTGTYKMGQLYFEETPGVEIRYTYLGNDTTIPSRATLIGAQAALNTALNTASFRNHFYACENIDQNLLTQNRTLPSDYKGEVQIQISPDIVHGLSVGSVCRLVTTTGSSGRHVVTKIDSSNSATRIWLIYRTDYSLADIYYSSPYKNTFITSDDAGNSWQTGTVTKSYTTSYLMNSDGSSIIARIIDLSYNNPQGNFSIAATVYNSAGTSVQSGTISFVGSSFTADPVFTTQPIASISAATLEDYTYLNFAVTTAQAQNNAQDVQLLIKCCENDPAYLNITSYTQLSGYPSSGTDEEKLIFIGNAIALKANNNIPRYIEDNTYGMFGNTQVGEKIAESIPSGGVVRWHFYGTPTECNTALTQVAYFRPVDFNKDFKVEMRIVNGRTRIYSSRGK